MKNDYHNVKDNEHHSRRFTTLFFLVVFVFIILLSSLAIGTTVLLILGKYGIIPTLMERRFSLVLPYLFVVSLIVSILITTVAGNISLKPLRSITKATKEIAAGNFAVQITEKGPREMRNLSRSFNEMARELGSIETLRSDFVNNISHEFKTPIVSIKGFTKLLRNDDLPPETRKEYLDIIAAEAERLTTLSSNVLLLSNLESTDHILEKSVFPLDEQLRRIILLLNPQFEERDIVINLANHVNIEASEELLQQVWMNLLNNAIKFTSVSDSIHVTLSSYDDYAEVKIRDTGIGMSEETLRHIFDKFYQENSSRSTEGNGLGLALVKRILDLNGGSITVKSQPQEGSEFTVFLPLYKKQ